MKEIICKRIDCKFNGELTCLSDIQVIDEFRKCISYKLDKRKAQYTTACTFTFKSKECGYVGKKKFCDKSIDKCLKLGRKYKMFNIPNNGNTFK